MKYYKLLRVQWDIIVRRELLFHSILKSKDITWESKTPISEPIKGGAAALFIGAAARGRCSHIGDLFSQMMSLSYFLKLGETSSSHLVKTLRFHVTCNLSCGNIIITFDLLQLMTFGPLLFALNFNVFHFGESSKLQRDHSLFIMYYNHVHCLGSLAGIIVPST